MIYLTEKELVYTNELVITRAKQGSAGVQYHQGLDLIVKQPQQEVFGRELYPNIWVKAAFILQKITKKHIFADGNKRTAIIATTLFLHKNGYKLIYDADDAEKMILFVTTNSDTDKIMLDIAKWLKEHTIVIKGDKNG